MHIDRYAAVQLNRYSLGGAAFFSVLIIGLTYFNAISGRVSRDSEEARLASVTFCDSSRSYVCTEELETRSIKTDDAPLEGAFEPGSFITDGAHMASHEGAAVHLIGISETGESAEGREQKELFLRGAIIPDDRSVRGDMDRHSAVTTSLPIPGTPEAGYRERQQKILLMERATIPAARFTQRMRTNRVLELQLRRVSEVYP